MSELCAKIVSDLWCVFWGYSSDYIVRTCFAHKPTPNLINIFTILPHQATYTSVSGLPLSILPITICVKCFQSFSGTILTSIVNPCRP